MVPTLPKEILEMIAGEYALAIVQDLSTHKQLPKATLIRNLEDITITREHQVTDLIGLLSSPLLVLLDVKNKIKFIRFDLTESIAGRPWVATSLQTMTRILPAVCTIALIGVSESWNASAFRCISQLKDVTSLTISSCRLSVAELRAWIFVFRKLTTLHVDGAHKAAYRGQDAPITTGSQRNPLRIQDLKLLLGSESEYGDILQEMEARLPQLRSLTIDIDVGNICGRNRFLREVGPQVKDLNLVLGGGRRAGW